MLAAWCAGIAAIAALVTRWAIVGPGFTWLATGVALLVGSIAALTASSAASWTGCALLALAFAAGRRRWIAVILCLAAAVVMLVAGSSDETPVLVLTAAVALGGVTGEMLLGHWYLVDPRLPRAALRKLCLVGLVGAGLDPAAAVILGALGSGADTVVVVGWVLLVLTTIALMAAVWSALGERGYPAVMAATGLSYLAVLTVIGVVVLGRVLVTGETGG